MGLGCGVVARCNRHIPANPLRVTYRTTSNFLSTVMLVAFNVAVYPSSHSLPMDISAPDWRWGKMCAVLDLVDNKGLRLSSALWVACMRLPFGRINNCHCCVLTLFAQGMSTFM